MTSMDWTGIQNSALSLYGVGPIWFIPHRMRVFEMNSALFKESSVDPSENVPHP